MNTIQNWYADPDSRWNAIKLPESKKWMTHSDVSFSCKCHSAIDGSQQCQMDDGQCIRQHVKFDIDCVVLNEDWKSEQQNWTNDVNLKF